MSVPRGAERTFGLKSFTFLFLVVSRDRTAAEKKQIPDDDDDLIKIRADEKNVIQNIGSEFFNLIRTLATESLNSFGHRHTDRKFNLSKVKKNPYNH